MTIVKKKSEIEILKEGGRILALIFEKFEKKIRPGVETIELERFFENQIQKFGGKPNFKAQENFPASICTSINEETVHCLPSKRKLKNGDIITLDVGMKYKGFHFDSARTYPVGRISKLKRDLINVTKKALELAARKIRAGLRVGDISYLIQSFVEKKGFNVVRELTGHGIGKELHEDPQIPNFGFPNKGPLFKEGEIVCLEPIVTKGDWRLKIDKDGFCYKTRDNLPSCHFEDMILIGKSNSLVLTKL